MKFINPESEARMADMFVVITNKIEIRGLLVPARFEYMEDTAEIKYFLSFPKQPNICRSCHFFTCRPYGAVYFKLLNVATDVTAHWA